MSLGQSIPSPPEKYTWEAKLRTELLGECSVRRGRIGGLKRHSFNVPFCTVGIHCQGDWNSHVIWTGHLLT